MERAFSTDYRNINAIRIKTIGQRQLFLRPQIILLVPTEISYLENRFCNLAIAAQRYEVKNGNDPTPGNITEEKESELEEFVDYAKLIMGTLGHKVFVPFTKKISSDIASPAPADNENGEIELFLTRTIKQYNITIHAHAKQTAEGFVVLSGSTVSPKDDNTIQSGVKQKRKRMDFMENKGRKNTT